MNILSEKFYFNPFIRPFIRLSCKLARAGDSRRDKKICGLPLGKFVPSPYEDKYGATGSQSVPYPGLEEIMNHVSFEEGDSLIDIGCGKGRVLAYLKSSGCKAPLTGIELNPEVASVASSWAKEYPEIIIICGNAFDIDFDRYTHFFMYRPMDLFTFLSFIKKLENSLSHPVNLLYYADIESGSYLEEREGWKILARDKVFFKKGFFVHLEPQRYTIYEFVPSAKQ
ncbi:MAG: class I SAM-dependent methyltransferase [Clostridiales bacterium]|nr:class I SAM-dependent methyltransferase [Clostridiales bacterium]